MSISDSTARDCTSGSRAIYEKEPHIQIDYSMLDEEEKEVRRIWLKLRQVDFNVFALLYMYLLLLSIPNN